jgi:hypothetical protein
MIESRVFGLANIFIPLKDEGKASSINLFLSSHDGLEPDGFPISGFPRVLLGEPNPQQKNARRPVRSSSEQTLRTSNRHLRSPSLDGDNISLNGPAPSIASSSEDSWQDTQAKMAQYVNKNGSPKMSLADLIAANQYQEGAGRSRTNRFWTYIGNNHMTQHPELYSPEELSKFALSASSPRPSELPTPMDDGHSMSGSLSAAMANGQPLPTIPQELEADDKATREMHQQQYYAAARDHARSSHISAISSSGISSANHTYNSSTSTAGAVSPPSRTSSLSTGYQLSSSVYNPHSSSSTNGHNGPPGPGQSRTLPQGTPREAIPSMCETEFDDDDETEAADRATYSTQNSSTASTAPTSNPGDEVRRPTSSSNSVVSSASTSVPNSPPRRPSIAATLASSPPLSSFAAFVAAAPVAAGPVKKDTSPPPEYTRDVVSPVPSERARNVVSPVPSEHTRRVASPAPSEHVRNVVSPVPSEHGRNVVSPEPPEHVRNVVSPVPPEEPEQRNNSFDSVLSYYDSPRLT